MKRILIIAEKPSVARTLAKALKEPGSRLEVHRRGRATYYSFDRGGDRIFVCSCLGHLFEADFRPELRTRWFYPVVDDPEGLVYEPRPEARDFIDVIKELANGADEIVIASDYDREGSFIGLTCLEQICRIDPRSPKVTRMLFNALTTSELRKSFEQRGPFDLNRALAGKLRCWLDLLWGANVSRGLTLAARRFVDVEVLSAGRVQTPTLRLILGRCLERERFVPRSYWEVHALFKVDGEVLRAVYQDPKPQDAKNPSRIFDRETALAIAEVCRELGHGRAEVRRSRVEEKPPIPFSLTILQVEGQRWFGFTPDRTKELAQSLYERALISYPRSASTRFDMRPGKHDRAYFRSLLSSLRAYKPELVDYVLKTTDFVPRQGRVFDGAHPPIHAVGVPTGKLSPEEEKLYELIYRRTIALFAPACIKEAVTVDVRVGQHRFHSSGVRMLEEGWRRVYTYSRLEEVRLPQVLDGQTLAIQGVEVSEGTTKAPPLYSPAEVIKLMESLGIGTVATRDAELNKLYERGYITGRRRIQTTQLGRAVVRTLQELVEELTLPQMTAKMEEALDRVERGQMDPKQLIEEAKRSVLSAMEKFKGQEEAIGRRLASVISSSGGLRGSSRRQ